MVHLKPFYVSVLAAVLYVRLVLLILQTALVDLYRQPAAQQAVTMSRGTCGMCCGKLWEWALPMNSKFLKLSTAGAVLMLFSAGEVAAAGKKHILIDGHGDRRPYAADSRAGGGKSHPIGTQPGTVSNGTKTHPIGQQDGPPPR